MNESEAGSSAPVPAGIQPDSPSEATLASDELEELTFPPSIEALSPLAAGTMVGANGELTILRHIETRGRVNRYEAEWRQSDRTVPVEAREAALDHQGLAREAEVLATTRFPMLPTYLGSLQHEQRRYVVVEPIEGQTLDDALQQGMRPEESLSVVVQLAQALRRLRRDQWSYVALGPTDVVLGQPLKIAHLGGALRAGEVPPQPIHIVGYSAPELAQPEPVTGKEDVYTLGAILFRTLAGEAVPETGAELAALPSRLPVPGAPQIVWHALAPAEDRMDLEEMYQHLLSFRQRLAREVLQLEIASATTVGLNPTRHVNEDSSAYLTWNTTGAEGVRQRCLLVMADGMGGMEAGEVASGTAVSSIVHGATATLADADAAIDPVGLIRSAATAVHAAGQGREMGTTVTVALVQDGRLSLGHVGDTRAYLLHAGELKQLTPDHSLVAAMVASGVLTREEARGHPDSNKVLRSLGSQRELPEGYVDDLSAVCGEPTLAVQSGDWLLLCSDGIWGTIEDDRIRTVLSEALDPQTAARALVDMALHAGAPDNATALVARCLPATWR